jgi:hypothetical protein
MSIIFLVFSIDAATLKSLFYVFVNSGKGEMLKFTCCTK